MYWSLGPGVMNSVLGRSPDVVILCICARLLPEGRELCSFNKVSIGQMVKMVAEMVSCCSETLAQLYPSDKKTPFRWKQQPTDRTTCRECFIKSRLPFDNHHWLATLVKVHHFFLVPFNSWGLLTCVAWILSVQTAVFLALFQGQRWHQYFHRASHGNFLPMALQHVRSELQAWENQSFTKKTGHLMYPKNESREIRDRKKKMPFGDFSHLLFSFFFFFWVY